MIKRVQIRCKPTTLEQHMPPDVCYLQRGVIRAQYFIYCARQMLVTECGFHLAIHFKMDLGKTTTYKYEDFVRSQNIFLEK